MVRRTHGATSPHSPFYTTLRSQLLLSCQMWSLPRSTAFKSSTFPSLRCNRSLADPKSHSRHHYLAALRSQLATTRSSTLSLCLATLNGTRMPLAVHQTTKPPKALQVKADVANSSKPHQDKNHSSPYHSDPVQEPQSIYNTLSPLHPSRIPSLRSPPYTSVLARRKYFFHRIGRGMFVILCLL